MRLRTTAAVFVGALVLVLPTAGPSAAEHRDGRPLGSLQYRYVDDAGRTREGRIRPADNDTCYLLTATSRRHPAVELTNRTRSRAVLFADTGCSGRSVATLDPRESVRGVKVVAALFRSAEGGRGDQGGNGGDGGDWGNGGNGGDQGGNGGDWSNGGDQGGNGGDWANGGNGGNGNNGGWSEGGEEGRGDQAADEQDEQDGQEAGEDFLSRLLRSVG
ncbi:hypothetical protein [Streptomyces sp. NPDC090112]|uniref:hypothetical protein n=1 Tax=Streptomyces sp. NPDC090112 TaxID=3365949 RepID=UPI003816201E